jgi:hypothetical protein
MIMKQISKRILFIFMSIMMAQPCPVQASAAAAGPAIKIAPAAAGFLARCGQKVGAATMKHVVRPAFVLGRAFAVTTAGAFGLYKGGELLLEKGNAIPAPAIPLPVPQVDAAQGFFGNLFNNWNWEINAPKIEAVAGKKIIEQSGSWGSFFSWLSGLDYMKTTRLGTLARENPTLSKCIFAYAAAGYAYIHLVKRLQLNTIHKKFFAGIDAAQNNRPADQNWVECQTILRNSGRGYGAYPTVQNAFDYINTLRSSDIDNGWIDVVFGPQVVWSRALRNDKMLWVF